MTYTFHSCGEPNYNDLFTIKDKIYYEIIHRLLKLGKTYVPRYFIRGMTGYIKDGFAHKCRIYVQIPFLHTNSFFKEVCN